MADRRTSPSDHGTNTASQTNQHSTTAPPPPPATSDTPTTPPASTNDGDAATLPSSSTSRTNQPTTTASTAPVATGDTPPTLPTSTNDAYAATTADQVRAAPPTPPSTTSATTAEEPTPSTPPTPPSTTSATTAEEPTPSSPTMVKLYDVRYQNAWRVDWALEEVLPVLAAFAQAAIKDAHANLLATKSSSEPGAATLADLPPCSEHKRNPGDARFRTSVLRNCVLCKPWLDALAAAHASGKYNDLNANHMYPNLWRDPIAGPWSIATIFTRAGSAATITEADATCLINVMLFYKLAFPSLTSDNHSRLKAIQTVRNKVSHLNQKKLSQEETMEYIGACVELLTEGPWTQAPFSDAAASALGRVLAWRDRPMEMLPQLDQLEPHYMPQPTSHSPG